MKFSDIIGNDRVKSLLKKSIIENNYAKAYLFFGPPGSGKTRMAYTFAQGILCSDFREHGDNCGVCPACKLMGDANYPDFYSVAPTKKTKTARDTTILIEQIRTLQRNLSLKSYYKSYKIAVIEEAHKMNINSANSFLKTLEEPPGDTIIILITDKKNLLLPTIVSRCISIPFTKPSRAEMKVWLLENFTKDESEADKYIAYSDANPRYLDYFSIGDYIAFTESIFSQLLTLLQNRDTILRKAIEFFDIQDVFKQIKLKKAMESVDKARVLLDIFSIFLLERLKKHDIPCADAAIEKTLKAIDDIEGYKVLIDRNVDFDIISANALNRIGEICMN